MLLSDKMLSCNTQPEVYINYGFWNWIRSCNQNFTFMEVIIMSNVCKEIKHSREYYLGYERAAH